MCTLGPPIPRKMHFHWGPDCLPPGVTANSMESLRCGNRKNNVIFMWADMGCPPHYHSAVMNGILCPHSHERTRHPPVPPNWLFTVFQHRRIFHRPRFVILPDAMTNLSQKFPRRWYIFIFLLRGQVPFPPQQLLAILLAFSFWVILFVWCS